MKHGSLFSGLGGFDLAASWLGWENIFQCEIDPFCQKVLKYHYPCYTPKQTKKLTLKIIQMAIKKLSNHGKQLKLEI